MIGQEKEAKKKIYRTVYENIRLEDINTSFSGFIVSWISEF